jgi:hypothetical protein
MRSPDINPRRYPLRALLICALLLLPLLFSGCASTQVTDRHEYVTDKLPKPNHILVFSFISSPDDVQPDSAFAGMFGHHAAPPTPQQVALGKQIGKELGDEIVQAIRAMGLPAEHVYGTVRPQVNDIVIRGYILSMQEGSAGERIAIGFGAGTSELRAAVEGFQMTPNGLRRVGQGTVESGGSKTPGAAMGALTFLATRNPAGLIVSSGVKVYGEESGSSTIQGRVKATAKEIEDALRQRFIQQGWISATAPGGSRNRF